ncbi:MAG: hypothetical protein EP329_03750 [Deltaproteobacteria bacterium]|nr:MAG: hypothetical protein EP329_03750 [Deltaproteobacteria bacterium]
MQLRLTAVAAVLLLVPFAACDDGGGTTPGTTTPGAEESAFDDYFGFGDGALASNDSTGTAQEACADDNCTSTTTDPMPTYTPPVCESPLAPPSGGLAACQGFCAKVTDCMGQPEAAAACASDCSASLAGVELAAVQQIFGCFTAASCDDIAAWNGGGSDTTQGGGSTDVPPATDASGADGGTETPVPADDNSSDPVPPREEGEVVVTVNPIGACFEAVFMGWFDATISAGKQAVCDAVPANEARCAGSETSVVEVSSGEAQASNGATPDGEASSGSSGSSGSSDQAPAQGDPLPVDEEEPTAEDYAGAAIECHAYGSLLSAQTMNRIGACDAMEDCDQRDACLQQVLVCAPFIQVLYFGGSATVSDDVAEPNTANTEPSTPTDTEPTPQ